MTGALSFMLKPCAWISAGWATAFAARWLDHRLDLLLDHGLVAVLRMPATGETARFCYPAFEIGAVLLMGAMAVMAGSVTQMAAGMAFSAALLLCAWIDWRNHILPDVVVLPLLVGGLALALGWHPFVDFGKALAGASLGWGMAAVTRGLGRGLGGCLGGGDIKLLAAIGAWLGPEAVAIVFLTASLLAAITMMIRQRWRYSGHLCFGPALAAGSIIYLFCIFTFSEVASTLLVDAKTDGSMREKCCEIFQAEHLLVQGIYLCGV